MQSNLKTHLLLILKTCSKYTCLHAESDKYCVLGLCKGLQNSVNYTVKKINIPGTGVTLHCTVYTTPAIL